MTQPALCVVGLGYIGLPTATMFAQAGMEVVGVDIDPRVRSTIAAGRTHIVEPGLSPIVQEVVAQGRLRVSERPVPADAYIIAVPTPHHHDTKEPVMRAVEAATASMAPVLARGSLVIHESTSPVGTTRRIGEQLARSRPDLTFPAQAGDVAEVQLAYCPERIIPGRMLHELVHNDRIVGGLTPTAAQRAASLYRAFVRGEIITTSAETAEMVKLTENSFRDVNIAFANELSMLCHDLGLDVWEVIRLANRHPRVQILNPGPGVGGHCIAVDPWFIVAANPTRSRLIRTAREVNLEKTRFVIDVVQQRLRRIEQPRILCLGLTFKPDVDDFRESPALEIACALTRMYPGSVRCCDPYAAALPVQARDAADLHLTDSGTGLQWANIVVVLVGHTAFRSLALPSHVDVIDTVGLFRHRDIASSR
ncbi:MAG: UDP-N-acetyl-D-mannosamine dehydrogenase [Rectinema sp.]|nr:UDP-N-acetyl-D-mannosamine dehydrogenase [Rectinema sp.]